VTRRPTVGQWDRARDTPGAGETLHVVRVFVGADGRGGNDLGVFLGASEWPAERRQAIALDLGFAETVFVSDCDRGVLRIHTPTVELPLAGHPLVGTAWLLAEVHGGVGCLRPPAGDVPTWSAGGITWIRADPAWAPPFELRQLPTPADVDAHPGAGPDEHLQVWSWRDESTGDIRARVFPTAVGITEDEATGSAALRLGARLGRPLTIHQGVGSVLLVEPGPDGSVAVGGRVEPVERRAYVAGR
jgi:predicted PhzF superfamily epimerase YddE/YHI9